MPVRVVETVEIQEAAFVWVQVLVWALVKVAVVLD